MDACSSCGSPEILASRQVECHRVHVYRTGNTDHRELIAKTDWTIELCQTCAGKKLAQSLKDRRVMMLLIGPGLVLVFIIIRTFAAVSGDFPFRNLGLLAGTLILVGGLIMIPVGFVRAATATRRLRELSQGQSLTLTDDEAWMASETEGWRIMGSLESGEKDFHGDFALPEGEIPEKLRGDLRYVIRRPGEGS